MNIEDVVTLVRLGFNAEQIRTIALKQNVAIGPLTKGDIDDVIEPKSKNDSLEVTE